MKVRLVALVGVLSLCSLITSNVEATTYNVAGGTWDYGKNWSHTVAYSNYLHPGNVHSSAVQVGDYYARSGNTVPGYWSYASAAPKWGETEQFYYKDYEE